MSAYNFFSLHIKSRTFPFHLEEALDGFPLAYPNSQHRSCTLGPLWSQIGSRGHTRCDTVTVGLTTQTAAQRLTGRECLQCGYASPREDPTTLLTVGAIGNVGTVCLELYMYCFRTTGN